MKAWVVSFFFVEAACAYFKIIYRWFHTWNLLLAQQTRKLPKKARKNTWSIKREPNCLIFRPFPNVTRHQLCIVLKYTHWSEIVPYIYFILKNLFFVKTVYKNMTCFLNLFKNVTKLNGDLPWLHSVLYAR